MDDDFSEAHLTKLFTARARGKFGLLVDIVKGAAILGKAIAEAVRNRRNPVRADDYFEKHPLEVERIRDAAGRTMVGEPER